MGCWVSKLPQENSMAPPRSDEFCEPEPLTEVSVTPTLLEESSEHLQEVSISPTPSVEFSSEFLNFVVDDRKDQHLIETTEENYPDAAPPEIGSDEIRPVNSWFTDEKFLVGHDEFFYDNASDEYLELDNVSDTTSIATNTLDTTNKEWKKIPLLSFVEIDQHAKDANIGKLQSFSSLIDYLKEGAQQRNNRETLIARAIVTWLSNQDVEKETYGKAGIHSPQELLQSLKERKMTYATCYAILCRNAGLKCTLIKGEVKAAKYEPGDTSVGSSSWTAVYVDGSWQIVNPFWVCRALYGHSLGGWVMVETDGKSVLEREKATTGIQVNTFQEYYFMPKPSEYIYECYTEQREWQLLHEKDIVETHDEFIRLPYLLPPFFGLGLELISERKCELESKDGVCKIQFRGQKKNAHLICLQYELFVKDTKDAVSIFLKENRLARMVFNSRSNVTFIFEVRFPVEGDYKLVIYGGLYRSSKLRLCEFKLKCRKGMSNFNLLPIDDNNMGWGPGPRTEADGLLLPSKINGLIPVPSAGQQKNVKCSFIVNKLMMNSREYSSILISSDSDGQEKEHHKSVHYGIDRRSGQFQVQATLPSDGEYALVIKSRKTPTNNDQVDGGRVCLYLLSTVTTKPRLKVPQKLAKEKLSEAFEPERGPNEKLIDTIEKIKEALNRCEKAGLDSSDDDVYAAEKRLEFLIAKNALRDCEMRRHLGVTTRTLERIERYRHKDALLTEIKRVVSLRGELETEMAHNK